MKGGRSRREVNTILSSEGLWERAETDDTHTTPTPCVPKPNLENPKNKAGNWSLERSRHYSSNGRQ